MQMHEVMTWIRGLPLERLEAELEAYEERFAKRNRNGRGYREEGQIRRALRRELKRKTH